MWWGRGRCTALSDAVSARHLSRETAQQLEVPLGQQSGSQWFPQQRVWWEVDCSFSQGPSGDLGARVRPRAGSCRAEQSWLSLPQLPTGQAQDLKQQWTPPHHPHFSDLMAGAVSMGCSPRRSQQLDIWTLPISKSFNQCQAPCSSFKNWSTLDHQSTPRRWPEVRVKLQGCCTSLLQVPLCGWGYSPKRSIVVS